MDKLGVDEQDRKDAAKKDTNGKVFRGSMRGGICVKEKQQNKGAKGQKG